MEKRPDGTAVVRETGEPVTVGRVEAMSKSKRNTIDPGAIIARYGADTARWFILSDNPPERDMEWTEAGVAGAFRFTQRVFRLAEALDGVRAEMMPDAFGPAGRTLRRATHRCIAAMTEALEGFAFNVAVARLYELANAITDAERAAPEAGLAWARREAVEMLARLSSPMMPHLAEEVYARLFPDNGHLVAELAWPEADPALLVAESVTIAVQVMGKLRGTIEVPPDALGGCQRRGGESRIQCREGAGRQAHRERDLRAQPHRQLRDRRMTHPLSRRTLCLGSLAASRHLERLRVPAGLYADRVRQDRRRRSENWHRSTSRSFPNGRGRSCARHCRSDLAMIPGHLRPMT